MTPNLGFSSRMDHMMLYRMQRDAESREVVSLNLTQMYPSIVTRVMTQPLNFIAPHPSTPQVNQVMVPIEDLYFYSSDYISQKEDQ